MANNFPPWWYWKLTVQTPKGVQTWNVGAEGEDQAECFWKVIKFFQNARYVGNVKVGILEAVVRKSGGMDEYGISFWGPGFRKEGDTTGITAGEQIWRALGRGPLYEAQQILDDAARKQWDKEHRVPAVESASKNVVRSRPMGKRDGRVIKGKP